MSNPATRKPQAPTSVIRFNLNSYIYVRITPAGHAWHKMQHATFNARTGRTDPYEPIYVSPNNGMSRFHAWEFMQLFGDAMYHGNPEPVCDMNVFLDLAQP